MGRVREFTYFNDNRLQEEKWRDYSAGSVVWTRSYTYNENDQVLTATDDNGTYTFTYDDLNRVATQQDPWGITLTYSYDAADRVTQITDTKGGTREYTYDNADRNTVRKFSATGQAARFDITWNDRNDVTEVKRYSDNSATTLVGSTVYAYDDARRVTSITHKNGAGTTIDSFTHTFDNADRVTQETSTLGPTRNYTYDDSDQLTGDGTSTWTFDKNGNRTNTGYSTTTGNRLTTDGTWNFTYDDEGNVTQKQHGSTTETWAYFYNQLNQLVKAEHEATSGGGIDKRLEFKYDVFGNRIEKSYDADGDGSGTATVTRFAYDGAGNAWADLDGSSSLTTRRLYLDAVDSLFARIGSSGSPEWYLADRLGSIRDIMNNSGSIIDHIDYAGFGVVTNETSPSNGDRYKFTGREYDAELTGLAYYRARYYRFDVGLWQNEDPKRFAAGDSNLYRYAGNSPTNFTDPSGLQHYVTNPGGLFQNHHVIPLHLYSGGVHSLPFSAAATQVFTNFTAPLPNHHGSTHPHSPYSAAVRPVVLNWMAANGVTPATMTAPQAYALIAHVQHHPNLWISGFLYAPFGIGVGPTGLPNTATMPGMGFTFGAGTGGFGALGGSGASGPAGLYGSTSATSAMLTDVVPPGAASAPPPMLRPRPWWMFFVKLNPYLAVSLEILNAMSQVRPPQRTRPSWTPIIGSEPTVPGPAWQFNPDPDDWAQQPPGWIRPPRPWEIHGPPYIPPAPPTPPVWNSAPHLNNPQPWWNSAPHLNNPHLPWPLILPWRPPADNAPPPSVFDGFD